MIWQFPTFYLSLLPFSAGIKRAENLPSLVIPVCAHHWGSICLVINWGKGLRFEFLSSFVHFLIKFRKEMYLYLTCEGYLTVIASKVTCGKASSDEHRMGNKEKPSTNVSLQSCESWQNQLTRLTYLSMLMPQSNHWSSFFRPPFNDVCWRLTNLDEK